MGIILKITLRNMKRRKVRFILTGIALIISVALFGGVSIVSDSFEVMMIDTIDQQLGTADLLFKPANSEDGWFNPNEVNNLLKSLTHVQSLAYRISGFDVYISSTDSGNQVDNSTRTDIYGIDIHSNDEKVIGGQPYVLSSLNDGNTVEELLDYTHEVTGNRVIVISQSLKIKLGRGFDVNDTVWILPYEGGAPEYDIYNTGTWLEYTVVGIIRDVGEAKDFDVSESSDQTSLFGIGISEGPGIFLSIENARILSNSTDSHPSEYNLGVISTDDIYSVASAVNDVQNNLDGLNDGLEWKTYDLKSDNLARISTTMSTIQTVFLIFGIIALILAIILMMNIFNIIRKEQEYETGMFQAIGASKSETFQMFLTQGLVLGLIGSTIGTISSYFISYVIFLAVIQGLQALVSAMGGLSITTFNIILLPETIMITFLIGLASCMIASIYPSWKASRKPIIECLNPIEEKSRRFKKHYLRIVMLFVSGGLLVISGFYLLNTSSPALNSIVSRQGTTTSGLVYRMFGPILILFGIIWIMALCLKPLNRAVVAIFKPYLGITKRLTEKNILRHKKRTTLTFVMVALTTSFLIGISTMMDSISSGINTTIDDFMGADVRIYTYDTPRSFEEGLLIQSGIEDVMGVSHQNAQIFIGSDWVGHATLDNDYTESIMVNIIDTDKIKERMASTNIISPSGMTIDELMEEIEGENKIFIMKDFAEDYGVKAGDVVPVKFSLGLTYANLSMILDVNPTNAREETYTVNMTISAIIDKMSGFSTTDLLGVMGQEKRYYVFVSWKTYEQIAPQNLPGGGTDIIFRQIADTGSETFDLYTGNWFTFSDVEDILNEIDEIDYYTTRMDYFTPTYAEGEMIDFYTSVVGIHTDSNGKLVSDEFFGNNTLIGNNESSMEELLDTSDNVCVIDERLLDGNPTLGIGSFINIFPQEFTSKTVSLDFANFAIDLYPDNYSSYLATAALMKTSDGLYGTFTSNDQYLAFNMTINMMDLLPPYDIHYYKTTSISIESYVNLPVDNLRLEALNIYSKSFDTIGYLNNTIETNQVFEFNPNRLYVNPETLDLTLRVVGMNSTNNGNYKLYIDRLRVNALESTEVIDDGSSWPSFEIVGIIEAPTYYNTEKYDWMAGVETGYDINNNYSIYINYEKAREIVYAEYSGATYSDDMITSVLVHCIHLENISSASSQIKSSLYDPEGPFWSVLNIKSLPLQLRTNVYDWFVWVKEGYDDEVALDDLLTYMEDRGHVVIFSYTKSFMNATFSTMVNLIIFITNSLLIFCIMIAMIGLTLHSLLTTMSRRREIGMLRSIGLGKKGVIRSISGETYVLSLLGLITGITSGILLGKLMVDTMPPGGFLTVTFTIPYITILTLVATVIFTVIASSRYPASWAAKLNIIDAVRTR